MTKQSNGRETAFVRLTGAEVSPALASAAVALVYLVLASAYILVSGAVARQLASSVADLQQIERFKGLAFVVVTAALLFAVNFALLSRMRRLESLERRMERALANAERTILAGTFARTIAHDINNGLSSAMLATSLLRDRVANDQAANDDVEIISSSLHRIAEWNRRFFEIGGRLAAQAGSIDLGNAVESAANLARHHRAAHSCTINVESHAVPGYRGVESVIQRAVLNLILNAIEAAGPEAKIDVKLEGTDGTYVLTVDDNGPGVPRELRLQILEPFFTTKAEGTGLGLASVVACARLHGGNVEVLDAPGGGARFRVTLGALESYDPLQHRSLADGPSVTKPRH
jgi:signal transduction histidine kinase